MIENNAPMTSVAYAHLAESILSLGMFRKYRNKIHPPADKIIIINNASMKWREKLVLNVILLCSKSPSPSERLTNLCETVVNVALRKPSKATEPHTMLNIPKSSTPNPSSIRRVEYKLITVVMPVFKYSNIVFATILFFEYIYVYN